MRTYKFKYDKLVRDNIPEKIIRSGAKISQKTLSNTQYIAALKNKLLEETLELSETKKPSETINELADVQEVIDNLLSALKLSALSLKKIQKEKNSKNGSFQDKKFINYIEVTDSYNWLEYHLKNKDKYPLIK